MTQGLVAKVGRTELITGNNTFIHPIKGPGTYAQVGEQISKEGLSRPTMAETADLVYTAWQNPENPYSQKVIEILKDRYLWGFTGSLWVPNQGVFIEDNPQIKDGRVSMNKTDLENRLGNDFKVRFVEFGFKIGEHKPSELAENKYVIGLAGEEGADKLAKTAEKYKVDPYLWTYYSVQYEGATVSALDSDWNDCRLDVIGIGRVLANGGVAFGVQKS